MYQESSPIKGKLTIYCYYFETAIMSVTFIRLSSLSEAGCEGKT